MEPEDEDREAEPEREDELFGALMERGREGARETEDLEEERTDPLGEEGRETEDLEEEGAVLRTGDLEIEGLETRALDPDVDGRDVPSELRGVTPDRLVLG